MLDRTLALDRTQGRILDVRQDAGHCTGWRSLGKMEDTAEVAGQDARSCRHWREILDNMQDALLTLHTAYNASQTAEQEDRRSTEPTQLAKF